MVRTTEQGLLAFRAYENALVLLEGSHESVRSSGAVSSLGGTWQRSWNTVIEQKDRTILPRPIILEQ